jgi:hypothetical protein
MEIFLRELYMKGGNNSTSRCSLPKYLVECTKDENFAIEGALVALRWRAGRSLFVRNGYLR